MSELAKHGLTEKEMAAAIIEYCGPFDDPRIGWCSLLPSKNPNEFTCERCGAEHEDCTKIEHKPDCSAKRLLDVLASLARFTREQP